MGSVYEELLRKFSEMSNEESGDHFTPRDVVKLLVSFVFGGDKQNLLGEGKIRSVFDPCCGTGGMLTIGKEWVHENINPNLKIDLYGQELNDVTYSICKSDLLMMDENPENIHGPCSSISDDRLQGRKFDYMITNPPFGVSWKSEEEFIKEEAKDPNGRFFVGTPRTSDGSLLFLQHLINKMNPEGSRIGIVFNGSPLFTGDAGSGESEIRKWIIENDWLECIVSLPDRMFLNTGITTYVWIVTNKKSPDRIGKVQLIDGTSFSTSMRKNLGDKGKYITEKQIQELFEIYQNNEENEFCKIYPNNFFGYTKVVVEQPLIEDGDIKNDRHGNPKPDTSKRDSERVLLSENVDEYYNREVKPHIPDSWMDRSKDKIGYEINFTKYFYKFTPLRSLEDISQDLKLLDDEIQQLSMEMNDLAGNQVFRGEWLEDIPLDWEQRKIKHLFSIKKEIVGELGHEVISITQRGAKLKDTESGEGQLSMDYSKYQLVKRGDFLMNHMDLLTGYVDISKFDGVTSPDYRVFVSSNNDVHSPYFLYVFQHCYKSKIFYGYGRGSSHLGRWRFPTVEFEDFYLPVPTPQEQKLIARYLDKKTDQIDRLVENIQKKIELLKEQRTSIINQCVTKGLDPNVEMKDSGVEWIGDIPNHWEFRKLKHLFRYKKGSLGQQLTSTFISENSGQYPVYSGQTENNGVLGMWDNHEFDFDGDVIFCTTVGAKLMTTRVVSGKFSLSQNCLIMTPKSDEIKSKYINYFLMYDFKIRRGLLPSILQPSLRMEDLDQYWITVPPELEQNSIIEHLDSLSDNSEELIQKLETKKTLLKEYRQSLISSAVTGKIRITEDMI